MASLYPTGGPSRKEGVGQRPTTRLGKAGYKLKDPDAIIRREDGSELAIEFGGRYDAERVQDLHVDCAQRGRPYELW